MAKRQGTLKGMEMPTIPEIDAAAENYREQRDKRMRLTVKEVDAKDALIALMRKHKLEVYRDSSAAPPLTVTITVSKTNVKVEEASAPLSDETSDDDETGD